MNEPIFIMMCGLPGSGKSTYAKKISKKYNATIHSSDALRKELTGDINNQNNNELVFQTLQKRIKEDLKNGKNCIYDACQITRKNRMSFLQQLNKIPCKKICILMATVYWECLARNQKRERTISDHIIKNMYMRFDPPYWYEGWNDIQIKYEEDSKNFYGYPTHWIDVVKDFDQENLHHFLTLGKHCEKTWRYICEKYNDDDKYLPLRIAAQLHDNGKPFCKTFKNSKGEITEQAHYYSHEHVGSYNSLFYIMTCNPLDVAVLIRWHMQLYFIKEDKTLNKYRKLWGEELYESLQMLHQADIKAH